MVVAGALGGGCRERGGAGESGSGSGSAGSGSGSGRKSESEGGSERLDAVGGDWIEKVDVGGGRFAYVTPATGAREKRPVVLAIHGAVDDPGLMCGAWRLVTDVYPFVVCPAGTPIGADGPNRKYVWGSTDQIEQRAMEALAAVEAKYPDHIVKGAPVLYTAFSQGATMAAPLLVKNAKRFPRAVLTEGGHRAFEPAGLAASYGRAGGERVLFTCSQGGCAGFFELSRAALERSKVEAKVVFSGPHGHSMPPPVRQSVHEALPWVIEGMAGWETYAAAPKLPSH